MFKSRLTRTGAILAASAIVATVAGCSATAPDAGAGADDAAGTTIVVSTFPFGVEEMKKAIVEPFEKSTGIKVEIDTGSNSERLSKLELNGKNSDIDVMLISDFYAALGQEKGVFQQLDANAVPNLATIPDFAKDPQFMGPAYSFQLNGTLFNTEKLTAAKAADWALYGDKANAGRTALPDISVTAGQLTVSAVGESYGSGPYDVDAAFKTMAGWAPNTLQFYKSSTEVTNLLLQGEIVAAPTLSGFATSLVAAGEPIAWTAPSKGRYMATNRAMVPAGAPNLPGAQKFIDYLLSVEAQTASADVVGDLPVNPGATVPKQLTDIVGPAAKDPVAAGYKTLDMKTIVANRDDWTKRFAREVTAR
ncbi:ABC transporter substrate-binding protein [Arthrobacter sp. HY1533]|uniref:ABC transporter substrate-binding protein n=1 Tax=Arthrobacter sp. HY1533 TaxID=2970919 RepID=UPI0022BA0EA9|nr:ABC transporter substrate-binding protein [Arthrobacter sp. HY1533]